MIDEYYLKRLRFLIAAGFCVFVFRWLGGAMGIPDSAAGFGGSILAHPRGIFSLVVIAIAFLALTAFGKLIVGTIRADASVFCAAIGLASLALRAGPTRYTFFGKSGSVCFTLAFELLALGAIVGLSWFTLRVFSRTSRGMNDPDAQFDESANFNDSLFTTAIHAFAMLTMLSILCRSDDRVQCLLSVAIAAWVASVVAHLSAPARPGVWYFASPILVGIIGYIWSSFSTQDLLIGQPGGYLSALARPLPLDYAGGGVAGAMLGYWVARGWSRESATDDLQESTAATA